MKITFEGKTYRDILDDMASVLAATSKHVINTVELPKTTLDDLLDDGLQGPGPEVRAQPEPVDNPVDKPVEKPKGVDRVAAMNKAREAKKAKAAAATAPEAPKEAPQPDPAEMVRIRTKTIEDLQSAYANGQQKEVFELLARFGNGAKSFRDRPPESFVPLRAAIDTGALI